MKKSELKNIIKECVKEIIFEEGILSGIITEVARGLNTANVLPAVRPLPAGPPPGTHMSETKKQVLSAIGNRGYDKAKQTFSNPELFEGTVPIPNSDGKGALSGVGSSDPGLDITTLPGFGNWGSIAKNIG